MLVANSFDLWQKDTFFSAAEEVQKSVDIMESAYRTWLRGRREGLIPQHLDELERELQMALGTAKWQLEEFEKAVSVSYRNHDNDITSTRHRQFISCIEDQITRVETALRESFKIEGKKPFRWVNLDEEECNDLALFLSGTAGTLKTAQNEDIKLGAAVISSPNKINNMIEHNSLDSEVASKTQTSNQEISLEEIITSEEDSNCFKPGDGISYQADRITSNRRNWNSPDRSTLEIVIDCDDMQKKRLSEETPKEKGSKPFFWRSRHEDHPGGKGVSSRIQFKIFSWMNQHLRRNQRSQRQQQVAQVLPVQSMRYILVLMLTIFLVVPFLFYST